MPDSDDIDMRERVESPFAGAVAGYILVLGLLAVAIIVGLFLLGNSLTSDFGGCQGQQPGCSMSNAPAQ